MLAVLVCVDLNAQPVELIVAIENSDLDWVIGLRFVDGRHEVESIESRVTREPGIQLN